MEWDKHEKATSEERAYQQYLMTNEINGAVEGALKGGAKEIFVLDGHGTGNLSVVDIKQLHPAAILYKGLGPITPKNVGMKKGRWDAMVFIGNHSMGGTKNGVLCHTFNRVTKAMYLNKLLVGEFGVWAAIAGDFGMPVIAVSGDKEACKQAKRLIPDIETAVVKYGTGLHRAWCLSPQKAKELISKKVEKAVKNWKNIKPFIIKGPVVLREEIENTVKEIKARTVTEAFEIRCGGVGSYSITRNEI